MSPQDIPAVISGAVVGFALGLIGGGGSIMAVPLLLYVVGVRDPHVAIGTSALSVSVNAFANLAQHARAGNVKWRCAATFAAAGVVGALIGSSAGKLVDGPHLLALFALVIIAVGISMLVRRGAEGDPNVRLTPAIAMKLAVIGFAAGLLSGFFGIGGGFLIVPGMMVGSGMPMLYAVGSSLFCVGAFGLSTAANYAISGLVAWRIALLFIAGGVAGGSLGMRTAIRIAGSRGALARVFAFVLFAVAAYMLYRSAGPLVGLGG